MARKFIFIIIASLSFLLSGCNKSSSNHYQGYAEGKYTYIYASFPGTLEKLAVTRGMNVQQNAPLFILDQEPEKSTYEKTVADLNQAKSAVNQFQANFILNQKNYERTVSLRKKSVVSVEALDTAKSAYEQSEAQLKQAKENVNALEASVNQSKWQIQQKTVYAPKTALVFDTYFLPGEWVSAGQPVVALLAKQDMKIIFFINEKELSQISLHQKVLLDCDSCKKTHEGRITFISPTAEYTPPIIYSDERRDKLVYRVEVFPENPEFFHPGMPVKVSVRINAVNYNVTTL